MKISSFFSSKFGELKSKLTHYSENEPLSKLAFVAVIFLDIFILITIFNGLEDHTRQLPTIDAYMPYDCQNMVVDANIKTHSEKISAIKNKLNIGYKYYPEIKDYVVYSPAEIYPICSDLDIKIKKMDSGGELKSLFEDLNNLEKIKYSLQSEIDKIKSNYDTAVLEKIANMGSEAQKMQEERNKKIGELNSINSQISELETKIVATQEYKDFWGYIEKDNFAKQKQLEKDLAMANFWFPVKKLAMELLFLIPLFLIFWYWNTASIAKSRNIQSFVSAHLLVISFIPIFFKVIEAIFEIIPKRFFEKILEFLAQFKLLAIWYYVLVLLGILVGLFVIYLIQRKIFSRERLNEKRLSAGDCWNCGKHLPANSHFCPFCGVNEFKKCPGCEKDTPYTSRYCVVCGLEQKIDLNLVKKIKKSK